MGWRAKAKGEGAKPEIQGEGRQKRFIEGNSVK
jgi:hypothetical protein